MGLTVNRFRNKQAIFVRGATQNQDVSATRSLQFNWHVGQPQFSIKRRY